ncbi:MAG: ATP-binding protein [Patescibacteria group bacterium]|nr:ATP-binding protein [Patescibacteria group bacterium]
MAKIVAESFKTGFITVIYGARRVGKTVLLEQVRALMKNDKVISFNGDTSEAVNALSTNSEVRLSGLVKDRDVIFVDEAQKIPGISLALKIIIDKYPEKKILVTGSSSLDLSRGAHENLTGRYRPFILFPLSTGELSYDMEPFQRQALLEDQLVFGGYPHVYALRDREERKKYLTDVARDYLFKDILELEQLRQPDGLKKLAAMIAFQIGQEVSLNELSSSLGMSVKTVAKYLSLLEKSFVLFKLDAFSTNPRKEIAKSKKYYFYDLGIRNALAEQWQPLSSRADVGQLWENFLMIERMKAKEYSGRISSSYFWRNYSGAEIDLIESADGKISAYEFKWSKDGAKTPNSFKENYGIEAETVNRDNYLPFVS